MLLKRIHAVSDLLQKDWAVYFFLSKIFIPRKQYTEPDFYISSSTAKNELTTMPQNEVISTERCSNCAILEEKISAYKGECFPFIIKNSLFEIFPTANSAYGVRKAK